MSLSSPPRLSSACRRWSFSHSASVSRLLPAARPRSPSLTSGSLRHRTGQSTFVHVANHHWQPNHTNASTAQARRSSARRLACLWLHFRCSGRIGVSHESPKSNGKKVVDELNRLASPPYLFPPFPSSAPSIMATISVFCFSMRFRTLAFSRSVCSLCCLFFLIREEMIR